MREHGLRAPYFPSRERGSKAHDRTITTSRPDEMWGTDATAALTQQGSAFIFFVVDHCTAECLGIHASASGSRHEALEPLRQGVRKVFRGYGASAAQGLSLRHDHGSQYMSHDFQQELRFLGIRSTPSFVAEPECNGVAERFVRTLKEQLLWARTFETIEDLRVALIDFMRRYNESWLVQKHNYLTPDQVRNKLTQPAALAA
jgi:transposase InsO family protein